MGKKGDRKALSDGKGKKRSKKKKSYASLPIEGALACPPAAMFFYELVVGNGIGENAVDDALDAYAKARDSRREKALEAAQNHAPGCGKDCVAGDHQVFGPFFGPQAWRIEDDDPQRATTWSWLGFQSVHFCHKA